MNPAVDLRARPGRMARNVCGALSRRRFLRNCGAFGLAAGAMSSGGGWRNAPGIAGALAAEPGADAALDWLREVGGHYRGRRIRMISEATPPSLVIQQLAREEFTPLTGIEVEIELLTLERVLQRISLDLSNDVSRYDLYYLDQSWIARFAAATIDPRDAWPERHELAMPGYDWADFQPSLIEGIATYREKLVGVPFDIPIFIMFYRQDILDELGLDVPRDIAGYATAIEAIQAEKAPQTYGTTGQCKAGHYSLNCEWTAWLWANGGSIFDAEGGFAGGDDAGMRGLEYLLRLHDSMPPHVNDWTWDGETESLLLGLAGIALTWAEIFPALDDPEQSLVAGLMQAAPPPRPLRLRPASDCGFGEIPNIGHQGGSAVGLARNSGNPEAAWIFLQWATSADVQTRSALLGGGASPTRRSVFDDPRVREAARAGAGTTRHFDAVRATIENFMGSEPDLPVWPEIANGVIPRELGNLLRGETRDSAEAMARIKTEVDSLTAPFRV